MSIAPPRPLPRRALGDTGLEVSVLGLGTVKLGRDEGVKFPSAFRIPDDRAARDLLALARECGINLIDTAPAYGNSEKRLGTLLAGHRDDWLICSKVGEEFEHGQSRFDFTPEHTRRSVERSLRRLATDRLDLVLVHSDGNDEAIIRDGGALEALAELKREGKVRAFGMSTKTVAGGLLAAERSDCVMVAWNRQYRDEVAVVDHCRAHNKGVLIKKALASGHLGTDEDPVEAALRMILGHVGVSSIIVGTINPTHLRANVAAAARVVYG